MLFIQVMYEDNLLKCHWIMLLKVVSVWPFKNYVNIMVFIRLYCEFCLWKTLSCDCYFWLCIFMSSFTKEKYFSCGKETVTLHSLLYFLFFDTPKSIWLRELFRKLLSLSLPPVKRTMKIIKKLDHWVSPCKPFFSKDLFLNQWNAKMYCTWHI